MRSCPAFILQRPLFACAAAYGAGVLAGGMWTGFGWLLPAAGIVCGLAAAAVLRKRAVLLAASLAACFFFLGVVLAGFAAHPALPPEGKYQVHGRVTGEALRREKDGRVAVRLSGVTLSDAGAVCRAGDAYWTYHPDKDQPLPLDGQEASFEGKLYHPARQENPYGFDFKMFLLERGMPIGITGARDLAFDPAVSGQPASLWIRARMYLAERLDSFLGEHSGLAKALILGQRDDLEEETVLAFRKAGIAHVLAVSGLHVSLMTGMLYALLRGLHLSHRTLFALFAALLLAYTRLLDFAPSIVRASVLTLIYLLGRAARRRVDPLTSLSAALLAILLVRPLDLFSLGFRLSFLAVLGIIALGDRLEFMLRRAAKRNRLNGGLIRLASAYIVTLSASALTALPLINAFHYFSLAGLMISPFAIAGISVMMGVYLAGMLLSAVCLPLARLLALPAAALTRGYEGLVARMADWPLSVIRLPQVQWYQALLVYALLALCTRFVALRTRARLAAAFVIIILMLLPATLPHPDPVRYIQLSAGTADSAVILDGQHTVVIDAGSHGGDLASLLLATGRKADKLLLTHLHLDHMGGLEQLLEQQVPIGEIWLPSGALEARLSDGSLRWLDLARDQGIPIKMAGAGDRIELDRVRGQVIWPHHGAAYPGLPANANSLVTLWDLDGVSLVNSGDIGAEYSRYLDISAQVLKVPHHGSTHDAAEALIRRVRPELALITASGAQPERYQASAERLLAAGSAYLITGETGAVTLTCREGQAEVSGYLEGGSMHGL